MIYETRQSNGHARNAGVEPNHAVTEEQERREGETHRPRAALPPHLKRGDEVDALSEVRVASISNVD